MSTHLNLGILMQTQLLLWFSKSLWYCMLKVICKQNANFKLIALCNNSLFTSRLINGYNKMLPFKIGNVWQNWYFFSLQIFNFIHLIWLIWLRYLQIFYINSEIKFLFSVLKRQEWNLQWLQNWNSISISQLNHLNLHLLYHISSHSNPFKNLVFYWNCLYNLHCNFEHQRLGWVSNLDLKAVFDCQSKASKMN